MNLKNRKLIPVAIFGGLVMLALIIRMNPPESEQRQAFDGAQLLVETQLVMARDYQITLESY